jgi:IS30 family transposase
MSYKQLTSEQRYQIYALKKMEHNQSEIADCIGVHKSTISRELSRNQGLRGYRPKQAHAKARMRRTGGLRNSIGSWSKKSCVWIGAQSRFRTG